MYFVDTAYRIKIKTNIDLTTASSVVIEYSGPFYTSGEWAATVTGKSAYKDVVIDPERPGIYRMQLVAVIDGDTRRTDIFSVTFERNL